MRYFRIFLLHIQQVLEQRSYMMVYLIISLISPILLVLFWSGATAGGKSIVPGWNFANIASYYFYLTLISGLLMAHVEYPVSRAHIKDGQLATFLVKPLPYFLQVFFSEFAWRIIRALLGIIIFIAFFLLWHNVIFSLHNSFLSWLVIVCILFSGFFLSFVIKMILGISAFWLIETTGLFESMEVVSFVFAGFLLPIPLLPPLLSNISTVLPFAYIIYYPVIALEGKLSFLEMFRLLGIQLCWIVASLVLYQFLWKKGIQKFTGAGQ